VRTSDERSSLAAIPPLARRDGAVLKCASNALVILLRALTRYYLLQVPVLTNPTAGARLQLLLILLWRVHVRKIDVDAVVRSGILASLCNIIAAPLTGLGNVKTEIDGKHTNSNGKDNDNGHGKDDINALGNHGEPDAVHTTRGFTGSTDVAQGSQLQPQLRRPLVKTPFGIGRLLASDSDADEMAKVQLPWGIASVQRKMLVPEVSHKESVIVLFFCAIRVICCLFFFLHPTLCPFFFCLAAFSSVYPDG
jgi:hypothetical protein